MSNEDLPAYMQGLSEEELKRYGYMARTPEEKKERKSRGTSYGHVKRKILAGEPLTGELLNMALGLIGEDQPGKTFFSDMTKKLKAGEPLGDYETHIMVDVLLLHARLG